MKLKDIILLILPIITISISSCSEKSESGDDSKVENEGKEKVTITLTNTLNVASPVAFKTTGITTPEEAKISSAKVYVFDSQKKLLKIENLDVLVDPAQILLDLNLGIYHFYVAANMNSFPDFGVGTLMDDVIKYNVVISDIAELTTPNKFWMTSTDVVTHDVKETIEHTEEVIDKPINTIEIELGRGMAKITVDFVAPVSSQSSGLLSDVEFRVKNFPAKSHLFPRFVNNAWETPNYNDVAIDPVDYLYTTDDDSHFKPTGTVMTPCQFPFYATENKNKTPIAANTTYVSIRGVYTPKNYIDNLSPPVTGDAFYRIYDLVAGGYTDDYYKDIKNAKYAARDMSRAYVATYDGGVTYYHVILEDAEQVIPSEIYSLRRNTHYLYRIKSVSHSGNPFEKGVDPEKPPIDKDMNINGELIIQDWIVWEDQTIM